MSILLDGWVVEEIKQNLMEYFQLNDNGGYHHQLYGMGEAVIKRENNRNNFQVEKSSFRTLKSVKK